MACSSADSICTDQWIHASMFSCRSSSPRRCPASSRMRCQSSKLRFSPSAISLRVANLRCRGYQFDGKREPARLLKNAQEGVCVQNILRPFFLLDTRFKELVAEIFR